MKLEVIKEPDKRLRKVSSNITCFNDDKFFNELLINMKDTMRFYNGVGLSAIQIGYNIRLILVYVEVPKITELIYIGNPVVTNRSKRIFSIDEGCLSCPGEVVRVPRNFQVTVEGTDPRSKKAMKRIFSGKSSVIVQHEIDHLDGKLITDYKGERDDK